MRKQELLERIEKLEEKVRLLEIALELHEMTKHPAPVVPYVPWAPVTPKMPWECPVWVCNTPNGTQPDNNGSDGMPGYPKPATDIVSLAAAQWGTTAVQ